jgi:hypothetical protein
VINTTDALPWIAPTNASIVNVITPLASRAASKSLLGQNYPQITQISQMMYF